ncbi:MAG: aminotransferase class III-fold pyridoxal phosphate-dependent enzyme [Eubacterium sp.]|nr:aminotransferase class III-fold pyridoxal phosphate-dependent enzyme [Eubacterium sp.]
MTFEEIRNNDKKYIVNMYGRFDMAVDHAEGATVFDVEGRKYIDMTAGIGVVSMGYADPGWIKAVSGQLEKYQHVSNLFYQEPGAELAEELVRRTGMSKALFVNSGSEANEAAFKIARKYGNTAAKGTGKPGKMEFSYGVFKGKAPESFDKGRNAIISLRDSFHGRTIAAITATGQEKYHKYFDPFAPGFYYADPGDLSGLKELADEVYPCAVVMELVQGEGGVNVLDKEFVKGVEKLCRERDIALIADEVQTGIGRTGSLFAFQQYDIKPDMVTFAKGIGNGLPIGGVICSDKYADVLEPGDHGCTYGMNPVCCSGASYVLSRIDDPFLAGVREKGEYIRERLEAFSEVEKTTGLGLMIGVVLKSMDPSEACVKLLENGVMTLTAGNKVRLLPPLVISYEEIDEAMKGFEKVFG